MICRRNTLTVANIEKRSVNNEGKKLMYGRVFNYRLHKFFPRELIKFERTLILAAFEAAS